MRDDKFNQIIGYLKAFEKLNCYCNHGSLFSFECLSYNGNLKSTILEKLKRENEQFKTSKINYISEFDEMDFNFDFKKVRNWTTVLANEIEFYFLGVFSADYTERYEHISDQRKNCIDIFIKMLIELFADYSIDVWASGIDTYYSSLTEYYSECSGIDFAFLCNEKIFLLHLGILD